MAALSKLRSTLLQCRPLAQTAPQVWASFSSTAADAPAGSQPQQAQASASPADARSGGQSRDQAGSGSPPGPRQQPSGGVRSLPPRGRGRVAGATRLADSIGVVVDEPRGDFRSGQDRPQRPRYFEGGDGRGRSTGAAQEREQAPRDDRRPSDAQRAPGGGGARPSLPERRELSRQAPTRSPGRDPRGGPGQGSAFDRPPVRHQPPRAAVAQGRPDSRGPAGLQSPRNDDRAAAEEEFFPGGQERVPRGLGRRQSSADAPGRRTDGDEQGAGGGYSGARGSGPSAAQRYAAGGRRGDTPPRGRRQRGSEDQDERRGSVVGARPRRIAQTQRSDRDIEREIAAVFNFDYSEDKEIERILAKRKESEANERAQARAAGTPMEAPYQYEQSQIKHEFEDVATADAIRDLFGEFDPRVNFNISSMPPRRGGTGTPEDFLEAIRADMMEGLHIDEAEWEDAVGNVLEGFEDAREAIGVRCGEAEDAALDALVVAQLPRDHPYFKQVSVSVDAVKSNPFWSFQQKQVFVTRLVKDMHAAL